MLGFLLKLIILCTKFFSDNYHSFSIQLLNMFLVNSFHVSCLLLHLLQVLATSRVPASMISLYYHAGFCRLMMRQYRVSSLPIFDLSIYVVLWPFDCVGSFHLSCSCFSISLSCCVGYCSSVFKHHCVCATCETALYTKILSTWPGTSHTLTHTHSLILTHTYIHPHSLSHTHSHTRTYVHSPTHSHTRTPTHTHSHTYTHTKTYTTHTHVLTHSHTRTVSDVQWIIDVLSFVGSETEWPDACYTGNGVGAISPG